MRRHLNEDQLDSYALERVDEAECALIEEHLLFCEECREQLGEIRDIIAALKCARFEWPPFSRN